MIEKIKKNDVILDTIKSLIKTPTGDSLCDIMFSEGMQKLLFYPTYDAYLTEEQFNAFKSFLTIINECEFYATNYYALSDEFSLRVLPDYNLFYLINRDVTYEQYMEIFLCELSIMFSKKSHWIIIVEESLDGGVGILAAQPKLFNAYKKCYPKHRQELESFIQLSNLEEERKNTKLDYYKHIMNLLNK